MKKAPFILFLSASAGTGHTQAAQAVCKSLHSIDPVISCDIINSYKFLNPVLETLMHDGYLYLIRLLPRLYGFMYDRKNKKYTLRGVKDWLNSTAAVSLKNTIDRLNPDLIVCTHAFPCGVLAEVKRKFGLKQKTVGIITDFVVSPFWIYPETDLYLTASPELKESLIERVVDEKKVFVTGIPIDPCFSASFCKEDTRRKLGLDSNLPLLLIMGGGLGLSPVEGVLDILKKINLPVQAVIIAGKNKRLKFKLDEALQKYRKGGNSGLYDKKIITLGFVNNIYEYMQASDLLITKPGGMTVSEAASAKIPMIITSPIPGQETRNAGYLKKKGAGLCVENESMLPEAIERLLKNKSLLQDMSQNISLIAEPQASEKAAKILLNLINHPLPK